MRIKSYDHWRKLGLEHKRLYQRNMSLAMTIVSALCAGLILLSYLVPNRKSLEPPRLVLADARVMLMTGQAGGKQQDHWTFERAFAGGFVDQVNITPAGPERSVAAPSLEPELADYFRFAIDSFVPFSLDFSGANEIALHGSGAGPADFGLPTENWLSGSHANPRRRSASTFSWSGDNRAGAILVSNIAWPGMPAKPADTGTVVVDITIHADATISYQFVSEEPAGKGFRRVTEQALIYKYDYLPRIVAGRPVETTVRLTVTICLNCELSVQSVGVNKDLYVGMKSPD